MKTGRYGHGCDVWTYKSQPGIVVAGGGGLDSEFLESVELYLLRDHSWIQLGSLVTPRTWHSVAAVNGMLIASGGFNKITKLTSVEYFNGTRSEWEVLTNLTDGRAYHGVVSVSAKLVDC